MKTAVTRKRNRERQKGAGMVESALVLLVMLSMIVFITDMGRILLLEQYITERARSTVRNAVVNNWDATKAKNYLVYNSTTAPGGGGAGFMGLQTSQVTYQTLGTAGTWDYRLQVKVSGVPALVLTPRIAGSYTLPPIVATLPAQSLGVTN
jgi:Flp pilus assembly protein TadG